MYNMRLNHDAEHPVNGIPVTESDIVSIEDSLFLSRYGIDHVIAESPYARVVRAKDMVDGTMCAIKIFPPGAPISPGILKIAHLQYASFIFRHPNLLMPLHFTVTGGRSVIVMPFVARGSLLACTRRTTPSRMLGEYGIISVIRQLALVLHQIHMRHSVHLDICPSNIMMMDSGRFALTDYGINRVFRNLLHHSCGPNGIMHPDYASPDRYLRNSAAPEDDIFSLGVVLYELAMGTLPWEADGGWNLMRGGPEAPALDEEFSPGLSRLVMRCLNRSASMRPCAEELWHWCRSYVPQSEEDAKKRLVRKEQRSCEPAELFNDATASDDQAVIAHGNGSLLLD